MASAQVNYKIERATEAIEDLTLAVVAAQAEPTPTGAYDNVLAARDELRDALADFVAPTLRVLPGGQ